MTRVLEVPADSAPDARASSEPHRSIPSRSGGRSGGGRRPGGTPRPEVPIEKWPCERPGEPYPPELWLRTSEPYPGAVVLEDLPRAAADAGAAQRILARFAALRLVLMVVDGAVPERGIADERAIAETYIDVLPAGDAERHALARMLAAAASDRRRDIVIHAIEAGDHAARHGQDAGAYWLCRTAYLLSHASRWRGESLRSATTIAAAARTGRAPKAARTWRRRARAIEQAIARSERQAQSEE